MSDDLIKLDEDCGQQLAGQVIKHNNRIEQLERERDELKAYIDRYSYAELADEAEARCRAEAKLAKAVEALRLADKVNLMPPIVAKTIHAVLAELEGK